MVFLVSSLSWFFMLSCGVYDGCASASFDGDAVLISCASVAGLTITVLLTTLEIICIFTIGICLSVLHIR